MIWLRDHVSGDGLAIALLLCASLGGQPLSKLAGAFEPYPQVKENIRVTARGLPVGVLDEVARVNARLAGKGRVLVRPSGTEPVVRVLAEAESEEEAKNLCARIARLVEDALE